MRLPSGQHLGYCTNVHPYHDVAGLVAALTTHAGPLRERLHPGRPLGVGLWFPDPVARELLEDTGPLERALDDLGLYVFTVNAFPQGAFHGPRVKDGVFRPSWRDPERRDYTLRAARVLASLLPEGVTGSVSTHTGGYKPWGPEANDHETIAGMLLEVVAGLERLEQETGRRVVLALEPEPLSTLETTEEVVDFFTRYVPARSRRHLGLCYDACHQAVEHEDMGASVSMLREAGVPVAKLQLSSALVLDRPGERAELLRPFAEDRWFHQVVARLADGSLELWPDLPLALDDARALAARSWRVHYHVPLFAEALDDAGHLVTTRDDLSRLLALAGPDFTPHLEIETYSFGAIPRARREALGAPELLDCLEREFRWVLETQAAGAPAPESG